MWWLRQEGGAGAGPEGGGGAGAAGGAAGGVDNPISRLAVARHAARARSPQYRVLEERGAARRREFVVQCDAPPHSATGLGPNKKTAKRRAAQSEHTAAHSRTLLYTPATSYNIPHTLQSANLPHTSAHSCTFHHTSRNSHTPILFKVLTFRIV